jgi:hypothetical protein
MCQAAATGLPASHICTIGRNLPSINCLGAAVVTCTIPTSPAAGALPDPSPDMSTATDGRSVITPHLKPHCLSCAAHAPFLRAGSGVHGDALARAQPTDEV